MNSYFGGGNFGGDATNWTDPPSNIATEFVRTPGLVRAECVHKNGYSYLEATVLGDPSDPRADDIPGDLRIGGAVSPFWGLHLIDVGIAMGNLLEIVDRQTRSYMNR